MNADLLYFDDNTTPHDVILGEKDIVRDLKLDILLDAMADRDPLLRDLCKNLLLHPSIHKQEILLRQQVLKEALRNYDFFACLYKISVEDLEKSLPYKEFLQPRYDRVISVAKRTISHVELAEIHLTQLDQVCHRVSATTTIPSCPPLAAFQDEILRKYTPNYLQGIKNILQELNCLKTSAELVLGGHPGNGLKSSQMKLHSISKPQKSLFRTKKAAAVIPLDTIVLISDSQEIVDAGLSPLLKMLSRFNQECSLLFDKLLKMFGFYVGSVKLYHKLSAKKIKVCFPSFSDQTNLSFKGLTDIGLVLKSNAPADIEGNTFSFSNKSLVIITGRNQGGKTTFLRSVGLAQLLSQCGLFVSADAFTCNLFQGIYTHFPNEEDKTLNKGLLEQELHGLDGLVNHMQPGSLLLMNETFSTTSEYDASILAEQILSAFVKCKVTTFFVTHLYEYAHKLYQSQPEHCIFLRAVSSPGSGVTYQLKEGEPLRSGLAIELYHQVID